MPLQIAGDCLYVAVPEDVPVNLYPELNLISGLHLIELIADRTSLDIWLDRCYGMRPEPSHTDVPCSRELEVHERTTGAGESLDVEELVARAVRLRASDIHIEPFEGTLHLRYRVDGVMQSQAPLPWSKRRFIVSRLKVLADLDIAEKRRPQDGKISHQVDGRSIDLRVSTTPTAYGEKVVLRILDRSAASELRVTIRDGATSRTKFTLIGRRH